jgi:myo-inositol-1(or 4)-monophosphatase
MHPFLTIADRATRIAGQRIMRALDRLDRLKIYEKQPYNFVTEVDYEVEKILIQHIQEAYPAHSILSEESGFLEKDSDYVWLIDPLDGTRNFIHGLPGFAISIAVQHKGQIEQALVYDPLAKETFYASRGRGARMHQKRLHVSTHPKLAGALLYNTRPAQDMTQFDAWCKWMCALMQESISMRELGSTALGLAYVAAGRLDGFVALNALKSWDIAAGALLIQEAGGVVCDTKGEPNYLESGKVMAANPKLIHHLVKSYPLSN